MEQGSQFSFKDFPTKFSSSRDVDSFWKYLQKQIQSPIKNLSSENELTQLNLRGKYILAYFNEENNSISQIYSKVANLLRDDCLFMQMINKFVSFNIIFELSFLSLKGHW